MSIRLKRWVSLRQETPGTAVNRDLPCSCLVASHQVDLGRASTGQDLRRLELLRNRHTPSLHSDPRERRAHSWTFNGFNHTDPTLER